MNGASCLLRWPLAISTEATLPDGYQLLIPIFYEIDSINETHGHHILSYSTRILIHLDRYEIGYEYLWV